MRWVRTALAAAILASCTGGTEGLGPGDEVRGTRLVRGAAEDVSMWDFCDPELAESGTFERACRVPRLDRLRIGPGWRAASSSALDREWEELEWRASLNGRPLALEEFGTLPDTDLGGAVVREWNVTAEGLSPGDHRLRALIAHGEQTYDVTWLIRVGG
jgi:hypothetical protein